MLKSLFAVLFSFPLLAGENDWALDYVKTFQDYPHEGLTFKWYSLLLKEPAAFKKVIKVFADRYRDSNIDAIVGLDSRGFIFGATLAYELNLPFVVVRKAGKLPGEVISVPYQLHYGKDRFEMEQGILSPGQQVVIIDDVVATGGTTIAAGKLVEQLGASVFEVACFLEFQFLNARNVIPYPLFSISKVEGN